MNGGIVATSVWFGKGDFATTENLAYRAADFADTDCKAANAASVVAAMHGMSALPPDEVAALNDRIHGPTMGPLNLTPPVDESIAALAERTAAIGEKILLAHGATLHGDNLVIPTQQPGTQEPELFKLSDLTQWWNPDWTWSALDSEAPAGGSSEFVVPPTWTVRHSPFGREMKSVEHYCVAPSNPATTPRSSSMWLPMPAEPGT